MDLIATTKLKCVSLFIYTDLFTAHKNISLDRAQQFYLLKLFFLHEISINTKYLHRYELNKIKKNDTRIL